MSIDPDLSASYFFIAETFSKESEESFQIDNMADLKICTAIMKEFDFKQ